MILLSALVVMLSAQWLMHRLGNRGAAMLSAVLRSVPFPLLVGLTLAGLGPGPGAPRYVALALMLFVAYAGMILSDAALTAMMADLTDEHEHRVGTRQEGLFYAANSFISKAMSGLGTFAASAALQLSHFPEQARPGEVTAEVASDLSRIVALGVLSLGALMVLLLTRYRLDLEAHARLVHLVAIRRHESRQGKGRKAFRDFSELITWPAVAPPAVLQEPAQTPLRSAPEHAAIVDGDPRGRAGPGAVVGVPGRGARRCAAGDRGGVVSRVRTAV